MMSVRSAVISDVVVAKEVRDNSTRTLQHVVRILDGPYFWSSISVSTFLGLGPVDLYAVRTEHHTIPGDNGPKNLVAVGIFSNEMLEIAKAAFV